MREAVRLYQQQGNTQGFYATLEPIKMFEKKRILGKVILMTIRETTIAKLQQLPEPLLKQVSDFIDLLTERKQQSTNTNNPESEPSKAWARWFESVDQLEVTPTDSASDYQQLLLIKYRQQGIEL